MKFVARLMAILGLTFSLSASAGIIAGGGGIGQTSLELTSQLLEQIALRKFTLLPLSAKDLKREADIPEDLKFIPDDEFSDLFYATTVYVTDENGSVLKTFDVSRNDETPQALIFVEVTESYD
jgi:hypothetical protein